MRKKEGERKNKWEKTKKKEKKENDLKINKNKELNIFFLLMWTKRRSFNVNYAILR